MSGEPTTVSFDCSLQKIVAGHRYDGGVDDDTDRGDQESDRKSDVVKSHRYAGHGNADANDTVVRGFQKVGASGLGVDVRLVKVIRQRTRRNDRF